MSDRNKTPFLLVSEDELVLRPYFGKREILPLSIFAVAFIVILVFLFLALLGIPFSVARAEWLGAAVSLVFAGLSAWLMRAAWKTILQTGPRQLRYLPQQDCFEIMRFGWKLRVPRTSIKTMCPHLDVSRGGFKKAAGIWLYLVLEKLDGKQIKFFLSRLPSLESANRLEVRSIFNQIGLRAGLVTSAARIEEI